MAKAAVRKDPGGWTFECSVCGFLSTRWGTRASAELRRDQHMAEHEGVQPSAKPANE